MRKSKTCQWFLLCTNTANRVRSHPTLGSVPVCQRCDDKVARMMCVEGMSQ